MSKLIDIHLDSSSLLFVDFLTCPNNVLDVEPRGVFKRWRRHKVLTPSNEIGRTR